MTADELQRRRAFITATDVPAILGLSPWRNATDVYWSKVKGVESPSNKAMEAGTLLESSVLKWAESELGTIHPGDWRVAENGINAASLDGTLADGGDVVEAKTSGIIGPGSPHQWGDAGTDEIPDYYLLQVQTQLLVTGRPQAWVPALIGGRGFVMYHVVANVELHAVITATSEQFWRQVQERQVPESLPRLETLKYLRREPGKIVSIAEELAANYLAAKEAKAEADALADEAKRAILSAFGDGDCGDCGDGFFTYHEQTTHYKAKPASETTFRVLRFKRN